MSTYTQFRLSNGDEIIAEVIQEPEGDEINIVISNHLMIIRAENIEEGFRYYSFRPWMSYQLNNDYLQLLNYGHIVGEARPDKALLHQYKKAIVMEKDNALANDLLDSSDAEGLELLFKKIAGGGDPDSDAASNVIRLMDFDKGKMH